MYAPMIAPGELIEGYLGRIKVVSQYRDLLTLRKKLINDYRQSSDYPYARKDEVRDLIDVMQIFTAKSRFELINDHTCFPACYWNWKFIDWKEFLRKRSEATLPFMKYSQHSAKICEKCVDLDKSQVGMSIWHRIHQVVGVTYCPAHPDYKLLRAKSSTQVYKYLPEWYLKHRELEPYENYHILSKSHLSKVQHYSELVASLMTRRDHITDQVLMRLIEKLKHHPRHQALKRRIPFEAANVPKTWFMSSKYPSRWLWTNFRESGDLDFYLPSLNNVQTGLWAEVVLVLASFTNSIEQVNLLINEECTGPLIGEMLLKMHQTHK